MITIPRSGGAPTVRFNNVCFANEPGGSSPTDLTDPMCVEDAPRIVPFSEIAEAVYRVRGNVIYTPFDRALMSDELGMEIFMKKEILQFTGAYKERGAVNTMLKMSPENQKRGIIGASLGNHSQALAYHSKRLGIPCTVVMPTVSPQIKIKKCRKFGANVILFGNNLAEAKKHAIELSKQQGLCFINGYDHPDIIAGQGTIGLEIAEQCKHLDAMLIPVGGAGLIAGVSTALKRLMPQCKIIAVESEACPSFHEALKAGHPVVAPCSSTLADGLAVSMVGFNSFETAKKLVDRSIVVSEHFIVQAICKLTETERYVCEGAGAICLAAILAGEMQEYKNKRVGMILTGGNIDGLGLAKCLNDCAGQNNT